MIGFACVAVGYLLGRFSARFLWRRGAMLTVCATARVGGLVAGGAAGVFVWQATAEISLGELLTDAYGFLHSLFGSGTVVAIALLFILMVIGVLYGVGVTAMVVLFLVGAVFLLTVPRRRVHRSDDTDSRWLTGQYADDVVDHNGQFVIVSAWRTATCAYARAVAAAVRAIETPGVIQLDVYGLTDCNVHLDAEGIAAQWDSFEGWSAMTPHGRQWYPDTLVPPPDTIARWLREVGREPRLGLGQPPVWRTEGDDEFAQLAEEVTLERLFAAGHRPVPKGDPTSDSPEHHPPRPRQSPE